jgi:hypothetical protein
MEENFRVSYSILFIHFNKYVDKVFLHEEICSGIESRVDLFSSKHFRFHVRDNVGISRIDRVFMPCLR